MIAMHNSSLRRYAAALALLTLATAAAAQAPAVPAAPTATTLPAATAPVPLSSLAWMEGCWKGLVNNRDFREQWMPLRGNLMVGISQTTMGDKTIGYEYLRFEPRADGVYYVILPSDAKEDSFRLSDRSDEKRGDVTYELFTFERTSSEFPQKIVYRRGTEGWLYAEVSGKVEGAERKIIYPMQRIDCATGHILDK